MYFCTDLPLESIPSSDFISFHDFRIMKLIKSFHTTIGVISFFYSTLTCELEQSINDINILSSLRLSKYKKKKKERLMKFS